MAIELTKLLNVAEVYLNQGSTIYPIKLFIPPQVQLLATEVFADSTQS